MNSTSLIKNIDSIARNGRRAAQTMADIPVGKINRVLRAMAAALNREKSAIQRENRKDVDAAVRKGLAPAMVDRLTLSDKAVAGMISGLKQVAALPSCVGETFDRRTRPNGLKIYKVRVPIGVIAIIYESRPNVTIDSAALCIKTGNAVILRGGSEAFYSNMALARLFRKELKRASLPEDAVQLVPTTDRAAIPLLLAKENEIDLVIPRGGEALIRTVVDKSRIPVIKHYKGVCHVYVSAQADLKKAIAIVINAKVQRPGVCNAMEKLLLDTKLGRTKQSAIINALIDNGVTLFGDKATCALSNKIKKAHESDWYMEYLDLRLAVAAVHGVEAAIDHINKYGSRHTDAIVTESKREASLFRRRVDSASIMVNASTRFADGGEYGMGCEIGISTDKLHARGPMGIEELTTYKWIVDGNGQVRT